MLLLPCLPLRAPCLPRRARVLASEAGSEVDAALLSAVAADHEAECAAGLAQYPTCATAAARPISTREVDDPFEYTQDHPFVGCPVRLASSLLPADVCSLIISEARERDTWDSRYTYAGSSDEAHLYSLPSSHAAVSAALPDVCAAAATLLAPQLPPTGLRVYNALVIRYSAARCRMPAHSDHSLVTVNVALNDAAQYRGGGTWFQALRAEEEQEEEASGSAAGSAADATLPGRVIRLSRAGDAVVHAGSLYHGGAPTLGGAAGF